MNELIEKIGESAVQAFKSGHNCSESIVIAFQNCNIIAINTESLKMVSGFGGGLGHARDLCGALAGSTMVIGALIGRSSVQEKPLQDIYEVTRAFRTEFLDKFGSTQCGELMKFEFGTREHLKGCMILSKNTAMLLAEFLDKKALLQQRRGKKC